MVLDKEICQQAQDADQDARPHDDQVHFLHAAGAHQVDHTGKRPQTEQHQTDGQKNFQRLKVGDHARHLGDIAIGIFEGTKFGSTGALAVVYGHIFDPVAIAQKCQGNRGHTGKSLGQQIDVLQRYTAAKNPQARIQVRKFTAGEKTGQFADEKLGRHAQQFKSAPFAVPRPHHLVGLGVERY